jgi:hypothetical protein
MPTTKRLKQKAREVSLSRLPLSQKQNKQNNQTADCMQICGHFDTNLKHDTSMLWGPWPQTVKSAA